MSEKKNTTTDAVKILRQRYIGTSKKRAAAVAAERKKLEIAEQLYYSRKRAANQK